MSREEIRIRTDQEMSAFLKRRTAVDILGVGRPFTRDAGRNKRGFRQAIDKRCRYGAATHMQRNPLLRDRFTPISMRRSAMAQKAAGGNQGGVKAKGGDDNRSSGRGGGGKGGSGNKGGSQSGPK